MELEKDTLSNMKVLKKQRYYLNVNYAMVLVLTFYLVNDFINPD